MRKALVCAGRDRSKRIHRDKGRFKSLDSASLCRSERNENESRGLQSKRCTYKGICYMLQRYKPNSVEETARLDGQRWRTKNMLRGT